MRILTDKELELIYRDRRLSRKINQDLLAERIRKDGRTPEQIDKAANIHKGTTRWLIASQWNSAAVWIIERIRLALKPQIRARYLYCPPDDPDDYTLMTESQKRERRIYDAVFDLCEMYSLQEVKEAVHEIDAEFTSYFENAGFKVAEVFEEGLKGLKSIGYDGEIIDDAS